MREIVGLTLLATALLTGCQTAESHRVAGDNFYLRGAYEQALDHYLTARTKDPNLLGLDDKIQDARLRWELRKGDEATQRGDWDAAEKAYNQVRRIDPGYDAVEEHVQEMIVKRANEHFRRGQELLGRSNPFDAIPEFEQALALQPEHPRAAGALEKALQEKNDREARAEAAFQDGLRAVAAEQLERAVHHFASARNLNPHHPSAASELESTETRWAESLTFRGDEALSERKWETAVEHYRKAQTIRPALSGLAQRLRRAQREAKAAALIAEGNAAFSTGDWRRAHDRFAQANELTREQTSFRERFTAARENLAAELYLKAKTADRAGSFEEAIPLYREVVAFYPDYRDAGERVEELDVALRTAQRAYEEGCRAQEVRDLREAREKFRICEELIPRFRDVAQRRKAVENAFQSAERLYERACRAEEHGQLERARILFEECLDIASPFRDASSRLEGVRERVMARASMQKRYDDGCRAQAERDLLAAVKFFEACVAVQPDYQDVPQRLETARASLVTARDLYSRAIEAENGGQLQRSRTLLEECLAITTPFEDAQKRLQRVRHALEQLKFALKLREQRKLLAAREQYRAVLEHYENHSEARRQKQRIDDTETQLLKAHDAMVESQHRGDFEQALQLARKIDATCANFHDVASRIPSLELEVDYATARDLEEKGELEQAAELYEDCARRDPRFRDARERARTCRKRAFERPPSESRAGEKRRHGEGRGALDPAQ